jgi:hypothetical protein
VSSLRNRTGDRYANEIARTTRALAMTSPGDTEHDNDGPDTKLPTRSEQAQTTAPRATIFALS